jgi:pimeloyl-ACP methyl ester carboxylesterase
MAIGAVVSLAGIGDLKGLGKAWALPCGDDTIARLIDLRGRKGAYADTSPAELLPSRVKVVMIHGAFDSVMPPYTGLAYATHVRKAGDQAEVVVIPDAGHFDLVIPTTPAWKTIVGIVERETEALGR